MMPEERDWRLDVKDRWELHCGMMAGSYVSHSAHTQCVCGHGTMDHSMDHFTKKRYCLVCACEDFLSVAKWEDAQPGGVV